MKSDISADKDVDERALRRSLHTFFFPLLLETVNLSRFRTEKNKIRFKCSQPMSDVAQHSPFCQSDLLPQCFYSQRAVVWKMLFVFTSKEITWRPADETVGFCGTICQLIYRAVVTAAVQREDRCSRDAG